LRGLRGFAGLSNPIGAGQSEILFLISCLFFGKFAQGSLGENTRKTPHNPATRLRPIIERQAADTVTSAPTGSIGDDVNDHLLPATVYKNIGHNRGRRDGARPHWVTPAIPFRILILMCGDQPERSSGV